MHPGSGPSDRDNDVYIPPIREHLLGRGIAVSSFDKRGVGGSTGEDPRPALERIRVPVLALFGADDTIVPVEASVSAYREVVRTELLTVEVFAGADHRVQTGDPSISLRGRIPRELTDFVLRAVA